MTDEPAIRMYPDEFHVAGQNEAFTSAYAPAAGAADRDDLWPCGCLRNDADAHRVGCPEYPEGRMGER